MSHLTGSGACVPADLAFRWASVSSLIASLFEVLVLRDGIPPAQVFEILDPAIRDIVEIGNAAERGDDVRTPLERVESFGRRAYIAAGFEDPYAGDPQGDAS